MILTSHYSLILFTIIFCSVSCNLHAPSCWRGGHLNNETGTCECPWLVISVNHRLNFRGWKNIEDRVPGQCASRSCGTGEGPDEIHQQCQCDDHFGGLNCDMCLDDFGCREVYKGNDSWVCNKDTVYSHERIHFQCENNEPAMQLLFGQTFTMQCDGVGYGTDLTFPNYCYFQFWRYNSSREGEVIWCNLYNVTFELLANEMVKYSGEKTWCECDTLNQTGDSLCRLSPEVKFIVDHMRGSAYIECSKAGDCTFKHENFPSFVLLQCKGTECYESDIPTPRKHRFDFVALFVPLGSVGVLSLSVCLTLTIVICCIVLCSAAVMCFIFSRRFVRPRGKGSREMISLLPKGYKIETDLKEYESVSSKDLCESCSIHTKEYRLGCGHEVCDQCSSQYYLCPICKVVTTRQKIFFKVKTKQKN